MSHDACALAVNGSTIDMRRWGWLIGAVLPAALCLANGLGMTIPFAPLQTVMSQMLLALVCIASVTDIMWFRIPNWLTYPFFLWALVLHVMAPWMPPSVQASLGALPWPDVALGAFLPAAVMLFIFALTNGGMGDIKLIMAIGALVGFNRVVDGILLAFVLAGAFAACRSLWAVGPIRLIKTAYHGIGHVIVPLWICPPSHDEQALLQQPLPLAPFFALGALAGILDAVPNQWLDVLQIR